MRFCGEIQLSPGQCRSGKKLFTNTTGSLRPRLGLSGLDVGRERGVWAMAAFRDERPDVKRIAWLAERMGARKMFITDAQTERFGRHPAGPILPDSCLETRRMPANYGMRVGLVIEGNMPDGPDFLLSATENGELCIGTIVDSQPTLFVGEKDYKLGEPEGRYHHYDVQKCIRFELLGFRNGEPVTLIKTARLVGFSRDSERFGTVFQGEKICATNVCAASLLSDGSLAYAEAAQGNENLPPMCENGDNIFRDGQFVYESYKIFRGFFLSPDNRLIGFNSFRGETQYVVPLSIEERSTYWDVADLVMFRGSLHWVEAREKGRDTYSWYAAPFGSSSERTWGVELGTNPYRSHLTSLGEHHLAYIGETTRDKMKCWVVDGVEQIGFDHVSPLFQRGETWCYWGAIDRHLCLMEIPR